jgi:hypothetical protein
MFFNFAVITLSVLVGDSVDVDVTDVEDVLLAVLGLADVLLLLVVSVTVDNEVEGTLLDGKLVLLPAVVCVLGVVNNVVTK